MLIVRHSEGSLEEVVAAHQNRNLAVSFGVLFLLCVSMGTIVVSARRAQRLAKSQMDFVAGVSHELRTPLAVICSAAENLADGVVASKDQVTQYGTLIRDEGRRLTGMVEQTLQFAAGQSNRQTYDLKPHHVADIVETALRQSAPAIEAAGCRVERNVAGDLPDVVVDRAALSQSLQNLIGNAVKYGGDSRWLGVRAETGESAAGGREVRILVEDKGFGISPAELPRVFDPFFRGKEVTSRQIHGTGLGLSLARDAVTAMGGRLSVKSKTGEGSTFTIHLPAGMGNGAAV
jgi:signal transduction histidine kinase